MTSAYDITHNRSFSYDVTYDVIYPQSHLEQDDLDQVNQPLLFIVIYKS